MGPTRLIGAECICPGSESTFEVVATKGTFVGLLPRTQVNELGVRHPSLIYNLAERLFTRMPELLALADFAINWRQLRAGQLVEEHSKR